MAKTDEIYERLKFYAAQNKNVLLIGQAGVGKTTMVKALAQEMNLELKYYSASTLDPWADLVGIPVPNQERDNITFIRPQDINRAEIVFFDELNRAHSKVQDAVLEIVQYHSINGEPLPHLRMCWAAINPPNDDKYHVSDMDIVLTDRFHVQIEVPVCISKAYFMRQGYKKDVVNACVGWWSNLNVEQRQKISPRRLEYMIQLAEINPDCLIDIVPWEVVVPINLLQQMLRGKVSTVLTMKRSDVLSNISKYIELVSANDEKSDAIAMAVVDSLIMGRIWLKTIGSCFELIKALPMEQQMRLISSLNLQKKLSQKHAERQIEKVLLAKMRQWVANPSIINV